MFMNNFITVIKNKGRIMREHSGVVRLPPGSEYSILLKNKDSRTAVARISVDGEDVMDGHRYIIPGKTQRELTGFLKGLNATHKFRVIKKTKQIARYRGDRLDDGMVEVEFWYEQAAVVTPRIYDDIEGWPDTVRAFTFSDGFFTDGLSSTEGHGPKTTLASANYCSTNIVSSGGIEVVKSATKASCNISTPKRDEIITVKGSKANQNFQYGNVGLLENYSSTIIIRLKSTVKKHGEVRHVEEVITTRSRIQCTTCGKRWRSHLKFCGNCSTALD